MITDTATELMSTIDMTDCEWQEYKILLWEKNNELLQIRRDWYANYKPDSEPTELTFRRTDEPLDDDGGPYVVAWMFWCTVLWGIAACAAFVCLRVS